MRHPTAALALPKWCVLLWFLLAASAGQAQAPAGGYALRPVQRLERVPLPPGGLVPYRSGGFWGYADTTGRVVIAPVLEGQPDFFMFGFGQVVEAPSTWDAPTTRPSAKESRMRVHSRFRFVNARGETLQGDDAHAILLLPDSSLQRVERRRHVAQPGVTAFHRDDYGNARITREPIEPLKVRFTMVSSLGSGRTLGYKRQHLPPKAYVLAPQLLRGALMDGEQHRLTRFAYAKIYPFREGFARFEYTGAGYNQQGLLDRNGRELLRHYNSVQGPYHNRILVNRVDKARNIVYGGIVDTTGRLVAPLEQRVLFWLIPGQLIGCYPNARSGEARLMSPEGALLLNGQLFRQVTRLSTDRLLVDCFEGQMGVLGSDLQWIVPCQQQQLRLLHDRHNRPDSTVIVVSRADKQGLLSMRDGRVVAPLRYDNIHASYYKGVFYGARRAGKEYTLNREGQEIIEARPADEYYEPDDKRRPITGTRLLAVVRPHEDTGLIGLIDSLGRARSQWQPYLRPGKREVWGHVFEDAPRPATLPPGQAPFTHLPNGWLVSDSLLVSPSGKSFGAPTGTTWRTRMVVGQYYEAAPFESGAYPTDKGFVTRGGIRLWAQ